MRLALVAWAQAPLVPHAVEQALAPEHEELELGPVQVRDHDGNNESANVVEPECAEVWIQP